MLLLVLVILITTFRRADCGCMLPEVEYLKEMVVDVELSEDGTVPHLGVLIITCQDTSFFTVYCTQDKVWSEEVKCDAPSPKCPELQLAPGIMFRAKGNARIFSCDRNLRLVGESHAVCLGNLWNVSFPRCERSEQCEDPPDVQNGSWTHRKSVDLPGFGPDDKAVYSCQTGFFLSRSSDKLELTCLADGSWDRRAPICHVDKEQVGCYEIPRGQIVCPDPGPGVNAIRRGVRQRLPCGNKFLVNTTLNYRCKDGFTFYNGLTEHMLTCLASGKWDSERHVCYSPRGCKDPGMVRYSSRHPEDIKIHGFTMGQEISYQCDVGYAMSNTTDGTVLTCLDSKQWDNDVPVCEKIVCSRPNPPENGKISAVYDHKQNFNVYDSIVFLCNEGYRLEGQGILTCTQATIGWNGQAPKCVATKGGYQTTPGPSERTSRPTVTATRTSATASPPVTETHGRPRCPEPREVKFSTRFDRQKYEGEFYPGDTVSFTCQSGYTLRNNSGKRITCGQNGEWNRPIPECISTTGQPHTTSQPPPESTSTLVVTMTRPSATPPPPVTETTKPRRPQCPEPRDVKFSRRLDHQKHQGIFSPEDSARYYCDTGYSLSSDSHRHIICGENGEWDRPTPICIRTTAESRTTPYYKEITSTPTRFVTRTAPTRLPPPTETPNLSLYPCQDPGEVTSAKRFISQNNRNGNFYTEDSVAYVCLQGHRLRNGDSELITCDAWGNWDKPNPTCIQSSVTDGPNTNPWFSERTTRPTRIVTHTGATLPTPVTETPPRTRPQCPDPGDVPNSERHVTRNTLGDLPHSERLLNKNRPARDDVPNSGRHHGGQPLSKTYLRTIRILTQNTHGDDPLSEILTKNTRSTIFYPGDSVAYRCLQGFTLDNADSERITCNDAGHWSKHKPRCIPTNVPTCLDPGNANHVKRRPEFTSNSKFYSGEQIEYSCDSGYHVKDDWRDPIILTCDHAGVWTEEVPVCTKILCSPPDKPRHARFSPVKSKYETGELVTFECDPGYALKGRSTLECDLTNADWSSISPTCKVEKCPDPSWPENGWRIGNDYRVGLSVSFECSSGFTLIGSKTRTCLPTKRWSGTTVVCDQGNSICPPLASPVGGHKDSISNNFWGVVKFSCGADFYLTGSKSRTCLRNGVWSGTEARCIYEEDFDDVDKTIDDIQIEIDTLAPQLNNSYCMTGSQSVAIDLYIIMAVSRSIDKSELQASKQFSKTFLEKLNATERTVNVGVIVFNSAVETVVSLDDGLSLSRVKDSIDSITETGGGRATASALRYLKEEVKNTGLKHRPGHKTVAMVIVDGVHNYGGNPVPVANELKQSPYNVDIYCVGYGRDLDKKSLNDMVSSSEKFWALPTASQLEMVTRGLQQSGAKSYSECGVGGLINISREKHRDGSRPVSDIRHWPWLAMIYLHEGGEAVSCTPETLRFLCGASLIYPQWLLTAKSCVANRPNPRNLYVRLGSMFDDDSGTIVKVDSVYYEPYRKDLALVKLTEPVVLTPKIRTVCLPAPGAWINDRKRITWGSAVGFVNEHLGDCLTRTADERPARTSHRHLHLTTMRRLPYRYCKRSASIINQRFYQRDSFCASSSTGRSAIKTKGFPFMTQTGTRSDSNRGRVVQTGLFSWATNCRGYYTKVSASMPWIEKTTGIKPQHAQMKSDKVGR